ncbi:MAG: hypothetical protein ACK4JY_08490 [Brevundimonas sp.]|uniref:hypothetical protein n=1 Tax=Brevundimonas sp. TaxID=1871086 RepID=UPI00391891E5
MSHRPPVLLAAILALAGNAACAQHGADRAAAEARQAAIRAGLNTSVASFCFQAPETDETAMTVQVEDLPASSLLPGAGAATAAQPVNVGSYLYRGDGVRITSDDPRFAGLIIDPVLFVPRLPNGDRLVTWNLAHATGGGTCRLALTPPAPPQRQRSLRAAEVGARAHLAGYRAGASWPFGRDRFIGLMHPEGEGDRTLIVTFVAGPDHETRVEAETPLAFQGIRANAPIHGGPWSLLVMGRQADGSIVQATLGAEPPIW